MQQQKPKFNTRTLALVGVLAAMVFAMSKLSIPIPTPVDNTRIHFGNIMCLLAGLLLGPVPGGLAAGIGSFFFDLTDPLFYYDAPFTFAFKFMMAWTCGKIAWGRSVPPIRRFVGAAAGALLYVALYLSKTFITYYFLHRLELETVLITMATKGLTSSFNAIIAVAAAVPLSAALRRGLSRVGYPLD